MNKILIFLLIINLNSCSAQKNTYNSNKISIYINDYDSRLEKLDASVLNQLSSLPKNDKEALPKQLTLLFKNKNIIVQGIGSDSYHFRQYDTTNNTVELDVQVNLNGGIYNLNPAKEKIDKLFYYSEIYLNKNIRSKVISSWLGFSINKGYKYDMEGNLIETIDYDEGYEFDYKKVLEFCKKNNIDILSRKGPSLNTIYNVTLENGRKVWVINYHNLVNNKIDTYQLDGYTGEIIQKWLDQELYGIKHY